MENFMVEGTGPEPTGQPETIKLKKRYTHPGTAKGTRQKTDGNKGGVGRRARAKKRGHAEPSGPLPAEEKKFREKQSADSRKARGLEAQKETK